MREYVQRDFFEPKDSLTVRMVDDPFEDCPEHTHEFFEFVYNERGKGVHYIDGRKYEIDEGCMLFINFGQTHSLCVRDSVYYNILVRPEYIGSALTKRSAEIFDLFALVMHGDDGRQCVRFPGEAARRMTELVHIIAREDENKERGYREAEDDVFGLILIMLLRELGTDGNAAYGRLRDVVGYIDEHYAEHISLKDISEKFFYNCSYFSRLFKKFVGEGFNAYVSSLRISKATELLAATDLSAEEIAGLVGYVGVKQFYAQFGKLTGLTPGEYRKRSRSSDPKE